jgi:S1-C subfamily serine protease
MRKRYVIVGGFIALTGLGSALGRPGNPDGPSAPAPECEPKREAAAPPLTRAEAEERAQAISTRISQAFVKVLQESGQHLEGIAAVIVSADGYVIYRSVSGGGKKTFVLADGRRATGTHLGWSAEWGVGLARLEGPGPWPHVELAPSDGTKAGQWVVSLGYPRNAPAGEPLLTVAPVRGSATGRWFVLDDGKLTTERNTPAVFDLDGRLVGVGFNPYLGGDLGTVYTDAKVIRALWDDLAAGKNLDELRLRDAGRPGGGDRPAAALTPEVEARAKAASVRIRLDPEDHGWSGTIVSADGVVLTCAHGLDFVTAGTKVVVGLPDGRDAVGEITGYNHVCDVCVVKITDQGPWPHVEVGRSTRLRAGDPCLMIGYGPVRDSDRQPRVRRTTAAEQWDSRWSHRFDFDQSVEIVGGDSGGGIFDADGRLVAHYVGERGPSRPGRYGHRVELFGVHHDEMAGSYEQAAPVRPPAGKSDPDR